MHEKTLLILPKGQDALLAKPISKTDYRVLWWMVKNLPAAGAVVTIQVVADGCGLALPVAARTINKLIIDGFVRRISKVGISYHYRLNTNWFGFV